MAADRDWHAFWSVPLAAASLLWPAVWNGYPIVFADTGTYLSQAMHRYLGWDRPPFYSLFMLPLHAGVSTWPVVAVQALLAAWVVLLVSRALLPGMGTRWLPVLVLPLAVGTWLPFLVCQLMPDVFTSLLVLVLCVLGVGGPSRLVRGGLVGFAGFMIAAQQSSLLLSVVLVGVLLAVGLVWRGLGRVFKSPPLPLREGEKSCLGSRLIVVAPGVIAVAALFAVNVVGHGRLTISPFGNVFVLARIIYDGPGMGVLRRDCPAAGWRLCPFLDRFPPTSDEFLWRSDSPIVLAGGHKAVSAEADAIIAAALRAEPGTELRAVLRNATEQLGRFASGDGLEPWPVEVTPWIERDFPPAERAAYASGLQARGKLVLPPWLATLHAAVVLAGVAGCLLLVPAALQRRHAAAPFLLVTLVVLPASALITGALSTPHDRYQSRIMWLPPFVAALSAAALIRRPA